MSRNALLTHLRTIAQNALLPPQLEIPVNASVMYGFDYINFLFPGLPAKQTGRLLGAQDAEPARVSEQKPLQDLS